MDEKISYKDLEEYQHLFALVPSFILKRMARKKSNVVQKFKPTVQSHIDNLTQDQRKKLEIILRSDVDELQYLMNEAYIKTNKKQFKILADPKNKEFIKLNLAELEKLL